MKSKTLEGPALEVKDILSHLVKDCEAKNLPIGYYQLLDEISRETPISALICSHNKKAVKMLKDYLNETRDIFASIEDLRTLQRDMPIIASIIEDVMKYENQIRKDDEISNYLPKCVAAILRSLIELKESFDNLAQEVDGEDPPKPSQPSAVAECYPTLPVHTEEENFHADKATDKGETKACQKCYPDVNFFSLLS